MTAVDAAWFRERFPQRAADSNKYDNGVVLIVAGSSGFRGAATLAAMGALRSGAGLVCVASTELVCAAVAAQVPEAILLPLPEQDGGIHGAGAERILAFTTGRSNAAAVFGPGLGQTTGTRQLLEKVWGSWTLPCVVDADALNFVARELSLPSGPCVLTPHEGEAKRLLGGFPGREEAVDALVARYGKTVVLKGPETVTGGEAGARYVNTSGNAGMATAGTGDVLAGIVGTLMAQGLPADEAAACGAFWHGLAGDMCLAEIGIGFGARDLAGALPAARRRMESN